MKIDIDALLSRLEAAQELAEANATFDRIVLDLGFAGVGYVDVDPSIVDPDGGIARYYYTTAKPEWTRTYVQESFLPDDPVVARVYRSILPFAWHEAELPRLPDDRARAQLVMDAAQDFGYRNGLVVPLHARDEAGTPSTSVSTLFWDGPEDGFQPHYLAVRHAAHLAAIHHHERTLALRPRLGERNLDPSVTLSARERDCLCWSARGKTSADISAILGISEATVNFHLRNSMRKLKVHNRLHAVSRAIRIGLIAP